MKMSELYQTFPEHSMLPGNSVHTAGNVRKRKESNNERIQKYQKLGKGTSFVEIISNCAHQTGNNDTASD